MNGRTARVFEPSRRDVPYRRAIIVGITGPSFSGKTFSAMRLGSGFIRVIGGKMHVIDTEADRARHYEDYFDFEHMPFPAPHGPLDYIDVIDSCVARGASVIVIDNMTHEHDGEGGVLDQIERFMEAKEQEYKEKGWSFNRETFNFSAQIVPKRQRKKLNQRIVQLGKQVVFILLYQAQEKIRPRKKGEKDEDGKPTREPENMGWQPVTTSVLPRDMTVRFLLTPACDGVPLLLPPNPEEKKLIKQPEQFKGWFRDGDQINEDMGARLANWAIGKSQTASSPPTAAEYQACATNAAFEVLEKRRADAWRTMPAGDKPRVKAASDAAKVRLSKPTEPTATGSQREPETKVFDIPSAIEAIKATPDQTTCDAAFEDVSTYFDKIGEELPVQIHGAYTDHTAALQSQLQL